VKFGSKLGVRISWVRHSWVLFVHQWARVKELGLFQQSKLSQQPWNQAASVESRWGFLYS